MLPGHEISGSKFQNFSKKILLANMKEHIDTSSMQVSVRLYHVQVRFYCRFKFARKSPIFFEHAENERSLAQKMRKKILIYSCVNRIEK